MRRPAKARPKGAVQALKGFEQETRAQRANARVGDLVHQRPTQRVAHRDEVPEQPGKRDQQPRAAQRHEPLPAVRLLPRQQPGKPRRPHKDPAARFRPDAQAAQQPGQPPARHAPARSRIGHHRGGEHGEEQRAQHGDQVVVADHPALKGKLGEKPHKSGGQQRYPLPLRQDETREGVGRQHGDEPQQRRQEARQVPRQRLAVPGPARGGRLKEHPHPARRVAQLPVGVGDHRHPLVRLPRGERRDKRIVKRRLKRLAQHRAFRLRQGVPRGKPAHIGEVRHLVGGLAQRHDGAVGKGKEQVGDYDEGEQATGRERGGEARRALWPRPCRVGAHRGFCSSR